MRAWKRWADQILPARIVNSAAIWPGTIYVCSAEVEVRVKESEPDEKETEALLELRREGAYDEKATLRTISEDAAADTEAVKGGASRPTGEEA